MYIKRRLFFFSAAADQQLNSLAQNFVGKWELEKSENFDAYLKVGFLFYFCSFFLALLCI